MSDLMESLRSLHAKVDEMSKSRVADQVILHDLYHTISQLSVKTELMEHIVSDQVAPKKTVVRKAKSTETSSGAVAVPMMPDDDDDTQSVVSVSEPKMVSPMSSKVVIEPPMMPEEVIEVQVTRSAPRKAPTINKKQFFHMKFEEDNNYFSKYITKLVIDSIERENASTWTSLSEDRRRKERADAYYQYMKTYHDSSLQDMKNNYIAECEKANKKIETKE